MRSLDGPFVRAIDLSSRSILAIERSVELIEPMGLSTLVHVSLAGNPVKIFTLDRPDFAVDSFIHIAFDMEKVHVFDTKTELRLPPENEPHTAQSA